MSEISHAFQTNKLCHIYCRLVCFPPELCQLQHSCSFKAHVQLERELHIQRWVCCTQACHICKHSAFPWNGCPQLHSLKVMFGVVFPGSSFSSLSYPLSMNDRRKCLSPLAPWWLSLQQGCSPSCLPLLHDHGSQVGHLLSGAGARGLELGEEPAERKDISPGDASGWCDPAWGRCAKAGSGDGCLTLLCGCSHILPCQCPASAGHSHASGSQPSLLLRTLFSCGFPVCSSAAPELPTLLDG